MSGGQHGTCLVQMVDEPRQIITLKVHHTLGVALPVHASLILLPIEDVVELIVKPGYARIEAMESL